MKLRPSRQSVKATILAAIAITTAIASNVTPSQAAPPTRVIQAPRQPAVVIFGNQSQSFTIGCQAVRDLFSGQPTQKVSLQEYQQIISSPSARLAGNLGCNVPMTKDLGLISPTYTKAGYAGVIVLNQIPFYVKNREFFTAMGLRVVVSNENNGQLFTFANREYLQKNAVIEAQVSLSPPNDNDGTKPTPAPPRPETAPINLIQNGVFFNGLSQWLAANNVTSIPGRATIAPLSSLSQNIVTTVGVKYRVKFDVLKKESLDPSSQGVSTSVRKSDVAFKLNQLTPTRNGDFDSYAFEFTGIDRSGSNSTSVPDTLTFSNASEFANLVIANVSIGVVK
jgi:hypothetical protein